MMKRTTASTRAGLPAPSPRRRAVWLLLLAGACSAHAAEEGLQEVVLQAERSSPVLPQARPAAAVVPAPLVSGLDLRMPVGTASIGSPATPDAGGTPAATVATASAPVSARSELDRLLGGEDGTGGTFDYTALPKDLDDSARYDARDGAAERSFDATVSVMAGTGGVMQTRASVTVPLLDDQLTVRISGATGTGYYRDFSGDVLGRGASRDLWDGERRYFDDGRPQSGQSFGLDVRWAPTESSSIDAHVSEESLRTRHRRR